MYVYICISTYIYVLLASFDFLALGQAHGHHYCG